MTRIAPLIALMHSLGWQPVGPPFGDFILSVAMSFLTGLAYMALAVLVLCLGAILCGRLARSPERDGPADIRR